MFHGPKPGARTKAIWKHSVWFSSWAIQLDLRSKIWKLNHLQEIREQHRSIVPLPLTVLISFECLSQLISFVLFLPNTKTNLRNDLNVVIHAQRWHGSESEWIFFAFFGNYPNMLKLPPVLAWNTNETHTKT